MKLLMDEFLSVIESQAKFYQSLVSVLREEHTAVVESRMEMLNEVNFKKEALILKIQILENQRSELMNKLSEVMGCPVQELTLAKLSQLTEKPYTKRLNACRSNLLPLIRSVCQANDRNRSLLTHSIDLVKGSIVLMNNLIASNAVYYRTGKIQSNDKNGKVFSGEI